MGGEAWSYFTLFEKRVEPALEKLRDRVFDTGQYRGSEMNPASPEEAMANSGPRWHGLDPGYHGHLADAGFLLRQAAVG